MTEEVKKEWISPSQEETEAVSEKIKKSIFPLIESINEPSEYNYKSAVRSLFTALELGRNIEGDADKEFAQAHPDNKTYGYYIDILDIIATCIAVTVIKTANGREKDINDYPPHSRIGEIIMTYGHMVKFLDSVNHFESLSGFDNFGDSDGKLAKELLDRP